MFKDLVRRTVPRLLRRRIKRVLIDVPCRIRDLGPDLLDLIRPVGTDFPIPPAALRRRVGHTSSRDEFLRHGSPICRDVIAMVEAAAKADERYGRWLDFGSGSGRVAREALRSTRVEEFWGVDVDRPAIEWDQRYLRPGRFVAIDPDPPTQLPNGYFDVVYAISVFTHLDETSQLAWLQELGRVLRPGGLLVASTHSEMIAHGTPGITEEHRTELATRGFLFVPGDGIFNDNATFHREEYMRSAWGRTFDPVIFRHRGLVEWQDLSAWRRRQVE